MNNLINEIEKKEIKFEDLDPMGASGKDIH